MRTPGYPVVSRSGVSLTEVLFSILVMGIGVVSLAALFPIGLDATREAIRDSRVALLAQDGRSRILTLDINALVNTDPDIRRELKSDQNTDAVPPVPGRDGKSRWVMFDPVGMLPGNAPTDPTMFAGSVGVARFHGNFTNPTAVHELCYSPDDIEFDTSGDPLDTDPGTSGTQIALTRNYMWAAFFRRTDVLQTEPMNTDPVGRTSAVELVVCIFYRREFGNNAEHAYTPTFGTAADGSYYVDLSYTSGTDPVPQLRVGSYLIDIRSSGEYVRFYRIENVGTTTVTSGTATVRVTIDQAGSSGTGSVVVVPGLKGVFRSQVVVDFQ